MHNHSNHFPVNGVQRHDGRVSVCIFCEIVAGTAEASIYADDELDPAHGARMFTVAQQLAAALRRTQLRCEGINLFLADGAAAGQDVFHVHLHVVPRFAGDPFRLHSGQRRAARADLDDVAARVRGALAG